MKTSAFQQKESKPPLGAGDRLKAFRRPFKRLSRIIGQEALWFAYFRAHSSQATSQVIRMTKHWPVQDAKARFSELLEASVTEGPQIITKRGVETAVFVSIEDWKQLRSALEAHAEPKDGRPSLKDLLLSDPRRFELDIPSRKSVVFCREPPAFD